MGARILDLGEAGPQSKSTPHGLLGRLATTVAIQLPKEWLPTQAVGRCWTDRALFGLKPSKSSAKELQDALLTLSCWEFGRQPVYNTKLEVHQQQSIRCRCRRGSTTTRDGRGDPRVSARSSMTAGVTKLRPPMSLSDTSATFPSCRCRSGIRHACSCFSNRL
jgi:hypothetical protein